MHSAMFAPPDVPPPSIEVEVIIVRPVDMAPRPGDVVYSRLQLTEEDMRGAPRPDIALRQAPGVSLFRRNGSEAANPTTQGLSLRAIAPSGAGRALVTLDGVPLNDPFGGWVIWSAVPTDRLETIDIVRGAGAGAWGAGALTGVLTLSEMRSESPSLRGDLSVGDHGLARTAVAFSEAGLTLSGSATRGPQFTPVRGAVRGEADQPLGLEAYSGSARLQRDLGPAAGAFALAAWREDRESGLAGAGSRAEGASASLTLAALEAGDGWRLQAWVRASNLENSSVSVAAGRATTTPASDQYATPALGWGVNAAWRVGEGPWSLEVGADARLAEGRAHERFRYQNGAFTRGRESGGRTSVAGLYAEGAWSGGRFTHSGGVRVDAWSQDGAVRRERDLATGASTLDSRAPGTSGLQGSLRFGSRYSLSDGLFLRAAAYTGFRPPTLNELHRPFRVGNDVTEANPALRPETLSGADRAAAAWTDAEVNGAAAAPQLTGLRPAQTARLTTTAGLVWRPVDAAVLEVDARHEGERFDDDLNTRRLKAAVTLDARAAWTFAPGTEVYIALDNLADARIPAAVAGDGAVSLAAPRTVRMGLTLRR